MSFRPWALPAALLAIASTSTVWYLQVSQIVPDPYLDEVFHVPQAQRYCHNDFSWDSKITTPPGLYLISLLLKPFMGCDTLSLRLLNLGAICLICPLSYAILQNRRHSYSKVLNHDSVEDHERSYLIDAHSALNICLFPPLFFFCVLYYTDVMSTLTVLACHYVYLGRGPNHSTSYDILEIVTGIIALSFRQTNIFWVAVLPAALTAVKTLKQHGTSKQLRTHEGFMRTLEQSWNYGIIYDYDVEQVTPRDLVLFILSASLVACQRPLLILRAVMPYIILLAVFVTFVAWNGSVVLGDKSAHVATIHLPQMLYIWPYFAFFSLPVMLNSLMSLSGSFLPKLLQARFQGWLAKVPFRAAKPDLRFAGFFFIFAFTAVRYNTIVHPFTLADNRHYVFYTFRLLLRYPFIKYLAVPVYYTCAWLTIRTLSSQGQVADRKSKQDSDIGPDAQASPWDISFIVMWIGTTTLSLATAPLVEPRYLILPWVIWRLHVPLIPLGAKSVKYTPLHVHLVLETLWLLVINISVGHIFLHRGFSWPSEAGKIQRFLW